ncbi:MAG: hypothetical protein ABI588_04650, partial [Arenimonas sp.]
AAAQHYRRAVQLVRRALSLRPGDPEATAALARALYSEGTFQFWNNDLAAAEKSFLEAIPILERRLRTTHSESVQREYGSAVIGLADVYFWSSKLELALKTYDRGCATIFATPANNFEAKDAIAVCHTRRADTLAWLERYDEAEIEIAKAIAIYQPMYAREPDNLNVAHSYGIALNKQGEIYSWHENFDRSFVVFSESLRIAERQYRADPTDLRAARDVAMAHNKRGDAYMETKRFPESIADYEAARAIFEKLWKNDPSQSEHERDYAISNHRLGIALVQGGNRAAATPYFDDEVAIMRRRWQASPTKAWSRRDLAVALEDRVETPAAPEQMCAWHRENRELLLALKHDAVATPTDLQELAKSETALGICPAPAG